MAWAGPNDCKWKANNFFLFFFFRLSGKLKIIHIFERPYYGCSKAVLWWPHRISASSNNIHNNSPSENLKVKWRPYKFYSLIFFLTFSKERFKCLKWSEMGSHTQIDHKYYHDIRMCVFECVNPKKTIIKSWKLV